MIVNPQYDLDHDLAEHPFLLLRREESHRHRPCAALVSAMFLSAWGDHLFSNKPRIYRGGALREQTKADDELSRSMFS